VRDDWAEWDVAALPAGTLKGVRWIPLSQDDYDSMIAAESLRNSVTYAGLRDDCAALAEKFSRLRVTLKGPEDSGADYMNLVPRGDFFEYNLFKQNENLTLKLLAVSGGGEWFSRFMTGWTDSLEAPLFASVSPPDVNAPALLAGGNLYDDANLRLNLLLKRALGRLIVRNAELTAGGVPSSRWAADEERSACLAEADMLNSYAFLLDRRNMPLFPANAADGSPQYIPQDEFFMMGDNRFNSLDMRHSYVDSLQPLSRLDPMPLLYISNIAPQTVAADRILGSPVLRVWPFSRFGSPGKQGRGTPQT
jgi:signal peptidase I